MITLRYAQDIPEPKPGLDGEDGKPGKTGVGVPGDPGADAPAPVPDLPDEHVASAGSTITLDLDASRIHRIIAQGNFTIALLGGYDGIKFSVSITQDVTGGRTVTWFSTIRWNDGGVAPTLTVAANKRDTFGFERFGAGETYDGFVIGKNI